MSRPMQRRQIARLAWLTIGVSSPALADGLGGLSGLNFILFVLSSIIPLSMMSKVFFATITGDKRRQAQAGVSLVLGVIWVIWGLISVGVQVSAALNPWLTGDTAATALICIALVVGNLMNFCTTWTSRGYLVGAAIAFIALQWTMAPGNVFYYDHDPIDVETESVRVLNENYVEWNERLIYSDAEIPYRFRSGETEPIQAIVERDEVDRYSIVASELNRDPRFDSQSSHRARTKTGFWFPIQPSHRLATLVYAGQLMPADWQAESDLLISAVRHRASDYWIRLLVEHGADVNYVDDKKSPLSIAVGRGDPVTVRLLGDLGADPNVELDRGNRLMHLAAREADYRDAWFLEILMEYGADPSIRNDYGQTVAEVLIAHLRAGGKTPAAQQRVREAWSRVLEN